MVTRTEGLEVVDIHSFEICTQRMIESAKERIGFGSYVVYPMDRVNPWHDKFGVALGSQVEALYEKHLGKYKWYQFSFIEYENWWFGRDIEEMKIDYRFALENKDDEEGVAAFLTECKGLVPSIERRDDHVMILTSLIKGGHESVARALERDFLSKGYAVEVVYTDEPEKDRLEEHGVTYKGKPVNFSKMRNELLIGMEDVPAGEVLSRVEMNIARYRPGECFERTLAKIVAFAPKLIISTCHHIIQEHFRYAIYTDQFKLALSDYREPAILPEKIKKDISFLAPTYRPDCIKTTLPLEPIPPAVDPSFLRPRTAEELSRLREKYEIPKGDRVVFISFGGAPAHPVVFSACKQLSKLEMKGISVIVACGENKALIGLICSHFPSYYLALPKVTAEEMADLFYLSDCIIGKPGGAMCMQVEAVAIPHFLIYAAYENEKPNLRAMVEMGLGSAVHLNRYENTSDLGEKIIEGFSFADERRLRRERRDYI